MKKYFKVFAINGKGKPTEIVIFHKPDTGWEVDNRFETIDGAESTIEQCGHLYVEYIILPVYQRK